MKKGQSKKSLIFIPLCLVLIFNIFAVSVLASDVAYIYKSKAKIDDNIIDVIEGMGLDVDLISERNLPSNFDDYKFVYIGDERFRNEDKIKIWKFPTIVSNYFFGDDWGFTDEDGVSKFASTSPLSVKQDGKVIQVYTDARFNVGGVSIPYYYLAEENKDNDFIKAASTFANDGDRIGDVISYGPAGSLLENEEIAEENICFFGIVESDYWTESAREMFEECIEFVAITCSEDRDCNDYFDEEPYCIGDDVYQDVKEFECRNPGEITSYCEDDRVTQFVESCPNGCYDGECVCSDYDGDNYDDCRIGDPGDDGRKLDCDDHDYMVNPGSAEICDGKDNDCDGIIDEGSNICGYGNVCSLGSCVDIVCHKDSDCGIDGFFDDLYCDGSGNDDVYQNYIDYTCENPGTVSSSCTQEVDSRLVTECSDTCHDGSCVSIVCHTDLDCDDGREDTFDICHNPGYLNSYCTHDGITCSDNNECGTDRFVGDLFCKGDDVYGDYVSFSCVYPGQQLSFCSDNVEDEFVDSCEFACAGGQCVRCDEDLDCNDHDSDTVDICRFGGSVDSYCDYEVISCYDDNDCGSDGYVGDRFCKYGDVYQDYREFDCKHPGYSASYCQEELDLRLIEECDYGCNNGYCLDATECSDSEDNDYDGLVDSEDPGCWHDPADPNTYDPNLDDEDNYDVACFNDYDCGFDVYIEPPYCSYDKVLQDSHVPVCYNPGTGISSCGEEVVTDVLDICSYNEVCSHGECVPEEDECLDVPIRSLNGIDTVTFYELSLPYERNEWNFDVDDSRVLNDISESTSNFDKYTGAGEYYDFYFSDEDGTENRNGKYVTVDNFRNNALTNIHTGNNIDAIELGFDDGSSVYAEVVTNVELGTGLSGSYLTNEGFVDNVLGSRDNQVAYMGDSHSSFTVGFCVEEEVFECNDGKDNDHDGKIDYPEDPGCDSPYDDDERNEEKDECVVMRVWNHERENEALSYTGLPSVSSASSGGTGYYAIKPNNLPSNVEWVDFNLYRNILDDDDVEDVDLLIISDVDLRDGLGPVFNTRTLSNSEIDLIEDLHEDGVGIVSFADNGWAYPALEGAADLTRQVINQITTKMYYSDNWVYSQRGTVYPDTVKYPFLKDVAFHFSAAFGGTNSPGLITNIRSPASCVTAQGTACNVAYLPPNNGDGFILASGNAWVSSDVIINNLIEEACGDGNDRDVEISKTDYEEYVYPGERLEYEIVVYNHEDDDLDDVFVKDILPDDVEFEDASDGGELNEELEGREFYFASTGLSQNWGGLNEKWFKGNIKGGVSDWYFITPDGRVYQWNNSPASALTGTLIENLDSYFYDNLEDLFMLSIDEDVVWWIIDIDDYDYEVLELEVEVEDDARHGRTLVNRVEVLDEYDEDETEVVKHHYDYNNDYSSSNYYNSSRNSKVGVSI